VDENVKKRIDTGSSRKEEDLKFAVSIEDVAIGALLRRRPS